MPRAAVNFDDLSVSGIEYVLGCATTSPDIIVSLFGKLLEPDQNPEFLQNYCGSIKQRFSTSGDNPFGPRVLGFDEFGKLCYANGIVKTMLAITQNIRPDSRCIIAGYQAMDALVHLLMTGTVSERQMFLDQLMENNVVQICLAKLKHPLCIHRQLAVHTLRTLSAEGFLGDKLSPSQISDIIMNLCQYSLAGPESFVEEMLSPVTSWQSQMFMGKVGVPSARSAKYVPRFYAMSQEKALLAAHGLLCRSPPPSRQFCLEILQHNPEILDLLFKCAVLPRPGWYPELEAASLASEVLVLLFHYPLDVVPGTSAPFEQVNFQNEADAEWTAMVESLKIFTGRPNWVEYIIAVWTMIDEERWQQVKPLFDRVKRDYLAQEPPDEESFRQIFEYRGGSRICTLRLIATMTHAADECGVTEADLSSLLRIGYVASHKIKGLDDIDAADEDGFYTCIERATELSRRPMYAHFTSDKVEASEQVADESVLGPTVLVQLLTTLAKRGTLDAIPQWTQLPNGTSASTSIGQVKQITKPEIVRKFLGLALRRVTARREVGHERLREGEVEDALMAYTTAAELAVALVAFDGATRRRFAQHMRGIYKELVLCLGNAAEMALRLNQHRKALGFGLCARSAGENAPSDEVIDTNVLTKNTRRIEAAQAGL